MHQLGKKWIEQAFGINHTKWNNQKVAKFESSNLWEWPIEHTTGINVAYRHKKQQYVSKRLY